MEWSEIAIEEYKTLRQESLISIQTQQAVIRYGLAIIGVLIASALNKWDDTILACSVTLVFLPISCYLILLIWMGEVARMMRAGQYLYKLESKLNKLFEKDNPPLNWEINLRDFSKGGTPQLNWNYLAILGILLFFAVASIVLGNIRIWNEVNSHFLIGLNVFEIIVFGITFIILLITGLRFR